MMKAPEIMTCLIMTPCIKIIKSDPCVENCLVRTPCIENSLIKTPASSQTPCIENGLVRTF